MKKILLLAFGVMVALPAFNQSKQFIVGKDLKPVAFVVPGYFLLSGKSLVVLNSTDITVTAGSSGTIDMTDTTKIYLFIPSGGATKLNYSVPTGTTVPPTTIPTFTVTASNSANGGTYSYPVTMSGQKTLAINYALAPGGNPANATVTMTFNGVAVWRGELIPTAGWQDYQTKTFAIPGAIGSGTLTVVINRGLNPRTYTFSK